jgi:hypothetical protein
MNFNLIKAKACIYDSFCWWNNNEKGNYIDDDDNDDDFVHTSTALQQQHSFHVDILVVHSVGEDGNLLIAMGLIINHFEHTIVIHHYESFVAQVLPISSTFRCVVFCT